MIDFDALVLAPLMGVFGEPITVQPCKSQPRLPSYEARGVWEEKPIDVQLADGNIMSSSVKTLGIRLSEFPAAIEQGDRIVRGDVTYAVEDTDDDGQGGSVLTLKEIRIVRP